MKRLQFCKFLVSVAIIGLVWTALAQAEEVKASGSVSYVTLSSETLPMSEGRSAVRLHQKGTVLADDPSTSIHLSSQDCFGTIIMSAEGVAVPAYGYCDGIDRDGDLWTLWWKNEKGGGSVWEFLGGTGKYEGVEGGGTTKEELQSPDGRTVISWEGKWTLK